MQLPLFLATPNQIGRKGVSVRLFTGMWIIDWDSPHTKMGLSINDASPEEISNLHKLSVDKEAKISLTILEPSSDKLVTAWAGRVF